MAWRAGVSEGIFEGMKALGQRKDMVEQCNGVSFAVWKYRKPLSHESWQVVTSCRSVGCNFFRSPFFNKFQIINR